MTLFKADAFKASIVLVPVELAVTLTSAPSRAQPDPLPGHDTGAQTWGNVDYTLNVDTRKLGLWPAGAFTI